MNTQVVNEADGDQTTNLPDIVHSSTFTKFFHKLSHGGYLLFPAALIALLWANINPSSYNDFWQLPLTLGLGKLSLSLSLAHLVPVYHFLSEFF
jgi:Na+/H+ antiporter NhaA